MRDSEHMTPDYSRWLAMPLAVELGVGVRTRPDEEAQQRPCGEKPANPGREQCPLTTGPDVRTRGDPMAGPRHGQETRAENDVQ